MSTPAFNDPVVLSKHDALDILATLEDAFEHLFEQETWTTLLFSVFDARELILNRLIR